MHDSADDPAIINPLNPANVGRQMRLNPRPLLVAQPKQILAHDPDPLPKTNQDRIVRSEKLMSFDPSTGNIDQGHIVYYRASKSDCSTCSLKPKCTTAIVRKITRDLNEQVRDQVRTLANTDAFHQSRR